MPPEQRLRLDQAVSETDHGGRLECIERPELLDGRKV